MTLSPTAEKFILHWGEMGTRWGVNRTVAQIHALLYISPRPLPADEICATLSVARSNVSTSIRELQGWGIIKTSQVLGDRRDHFESMTDVWEMFRVIMDERKKREIDPHPGRAPRVRSGSKKGQKGGPHHRQTAHRAAWFRRNYVDVLPPGPRPARFCHGEVCRHGQEDPRPAWPEITPDA